MALDVDVDKILDIHVESIKNLCSGHYTRSQIDGWIEALTPGWYQARMQTGTWIVAERDSQLTGFGSLCIDSAEVRAVFVHPTYAGSGIGRQLLRELERLAMQAGIRLLRLDSSLNAVEFYSREGYGDQTPGLHEIASGEHIECVTMTKELR